MVKGTHFRILPGVATAVLLHIIGYQVLLAEDSEILARSFAQHQAEGTFVAYDPMGGKTFIHNRKRSNERFVPASTFKIVNALIGLRSGAVKNVDETLPYGGQPQPFTSWERDMSLRDAMPISNVPIYQELARRIGLEEMRRAVKGFQYGNAEVGDVVDRFWLDGPLKISAVEQVEFLRRMLDGKLGLPENITRAVRDITLLETTSEYELHGKTGWHGAGNMGWFIGWVTTREGTVYPFAMNMNIEDQEQLPKRIILARQCLSILGILPADRNP